MFKEMTKGKRVAFIVAICLANVAVMGEMVFTPVIYNVYEAFWESSITVVNTIVSGPMIFIALASLVLAPMLLSRIGSKGTMFAGGILFTVFGLAGYVAQSAEILLLFRVLYAVGIALVTSAATTMIAEVCQEEDDRNKVMGYYNAAMNGLGAVLALVSGMLAVSNWRGSFLLYAAGIVMLVGFFTLPGTGKASDVPADTSDVPASKESLGAKFWLLIIGFVIFNMAFGVSLFYGSVFTAENALGNSAFAGLLSAVNTVSGVILCLFYDKIYGALKGRTGVVIYLLAGVSMVVVSLFPSTVTALVCYFFLGGGYGLCFANTFARASFIVPESRIGSAMSICTAAYSLGGFFTTYFVTAVQGLMATELVTPLYLVAGIICAVLAVYEFLCNLRQEG